MSDADLAGQESADAEAPMSPADDPGTAGPPAPVPHAGIRYATLRLLTLVVVGALLYLVGMRGWLLAFAAVLVSGLISLFLLMKQRNDAAVNLERTLEHWRARQAHDEDEDDGYETDAGGEAGADAAQDARTPAKDPVAAEDPAHAGDQPAGPPPVEPEPPAR
jgi:hypothetical protein